MGKKRGSYSSPAQIERRLRILKCSLELMRLEGLGGVTIKSVATCTGVSLKTVHNIFGTRDEMLVQAASLQMDTLQIDKQLMSMEPGLPQLLLFTEAVMHQFRQTPEFMAIILGVIFKSDDNLAVSKTRIRHIHQMAMRCLQAAQDNGELRPGTDLSTLADLVSGNQWGTVFLWLRQLITLEQFTNQTLINHCVTVMPFCVGERKRWLETKLEQLLADSVTGSIESIATESGRLLLADTYDG